MLYLVLRPFHDLDPAVASADCLSRSLQDNLCLGAQSFCKGCSLLTAQTSLLQFKSGSFHIAFDKGALDALMGEDTEAASIAGSQLLSEVQRVLNSCEGHYLCVTLGQPHVLGNAPSRLF